MFATIAHPQKRAFLTAFAELGVVKEAAKIAGVSREIHYEWKSTDPDYAAAFEEATEMAADALEDEARTLATATGAARSEKMLIFLLRGLRPQRYGTKRIETKGEVAHTHRVVPDLSGFSDVELAELKRLAAKASDRRGPPRLIADRSGDPSPEEEKD